MNPNEIENFMRRHQLNPRDFANLLGVTVGGVTHWLSGRRSPGITTVRLLKLFDHYPTLIKEFNK